MGFVMARRLGWGVGEEERGGFQDEGKLIDFLSIIFVVSMPFQRETSFGALGSCDSRIGVLKS